MLVATAAVVVAAAAAASAAAAAVMVLRRERPPHKQTSMEWHSGENRHEKKRLRMYKANMYTRYVLVRNGIHLLAVTIRHFTLRRSTIEVHPKLYEAPHLRSSLRQPKN